MSIGLEFSFRAFVEVGKDLEIGTIHSGIREITPIIGGTFEGPNIKGTVIPGGADWSLTRNDGVIEIDARYTLKTNDDVLIYIKNQGLVIEESPNNDMKTEYFRTTPTFEVSNSKYDWLIRSLFVCNIESVFDEDNEFVGVSIEFYKVT